MATKAKEEKPQNIDDILFKCRDILRAARNSGSFFEKRDLMLTLVFLRFIGEKYDDGVQALREKLVSEGLNPDDPKIFKAFFDDATFADGTFPLPKESRWSELINIPYFLRRGKRGMPRGGGQGGTLLLNITVVPQF